MVKKSTSSMLLTKLRKQMKEITLRVPEELVSELEALAKKLAILVAGTDEDLSADDYDTSFREAILELIKDSVIRKPRDYAWIMAAVNDGVVNDAEPFVSPQDFIDYLNGLGIDNLPCRSTLSSAYASIDGRFPSWSFGALLVTVAEMNHRKDVVIRFRSAFARAKRRRLDKKMDN
jgi:hypothetical protein